MITTTIRKVFSDNNRRSRRLRCTIVPIIVFIVCCIFFGYRWSATSYQENEVILDDTVLRQNSYEDFNRMIHEKPKQEEEKKDVHEVEKGDDIVKLVKKDAQKAVKAEVLKNDYNLQEDEEEQLPRLSDADDKAHALKNAVPFAIIDHPHQVDSKHRPRPRVHQIKCPKENFVILVHSEAEHFQMRRVIRMTWGQSTNSHTRYLQIRPHLFRVLFVVGRSSYKSKLQQEAHENGDLLLLDLDDYGGEHSRKLKAGLQWFLHNATEKASGTVCTASLLLKVNDDTFVNMPAFSHWLVGKFKGLHNKVYMGHRIHGMSPNRDSKSDSYIPYHSYQSDVFPDLIRSPVFLLSRDVVQGVVEQMEKVDLMNMEDGYLGVLAMKAGISPKHNEHFVILRRSSDMCNHLNIFFTGGLDEEGQSEIFDFNKVKANIRRCQEPYDHEPRDL